MSDKMTDHDLNSLYHQGATEQPSDALDQCILASAEKQANIAHVQHSHSEKHTNRMVNNNNTVNNSTFNNNNSATLTVEESDVNASSDKPSTQDVVALPTKIQAKKIFSRKKPLYKTWYGQLSTAASLVFVAALYLQNQPPIRSFAPPHDTASYDEQQIGSERLESEMLDSQMQQSEEIEAAIHSQQKENHSMMMQSNKMSQQKQQASAEALQGLQDRSLPQAKVIENNQPSSIIEGLKIIALHLEKGEKEQANIVLKALLTAYPERQKEITASYESLQKSNLEKDDR